MMRPTKRTINRIGHQLCCLYPSQSHHDRIAGQSSLLCMYAYCPGLSWIRSLVLETCRRQTVVIDRGEQQRRNNLTLWKWPRRVHNNWYREGHGQEPSQLLFIDIFIILFCACLGCVVVVLCSYFHKQYGWRNLKPDLLVLWQSSRLLFFPDKQSGSSTRNENRRGWWWSLALGKRVSN